MCIVTEFPSTTLPSILVKNKSTFKMTYFAETCAMHSKSTNTYRLVISSGQIYRKHGSLDLRYDNTIQVFAKQCILFFSERF